MPVRLSGRSLTFYAVRTVAVWLIAASFTCASLADDSKVRLTVKRDANIWHGRAANVYVYANGQHVGTLVNGERSTFAFPISSSGTYDITFNDWTGLAASNMLTVQAKADEHIVCSVGTEIGWWSGGLRGRDVYVEPVYPTKIFVQTDRPKEIVLNDKVYLLTVT